MKGRFYYLSFGEGGERGGARRLGRRWNVMRDEGLYLVSCIFSSSFFATVCCLERLLTLPRMFIAFLSSSDLCCLGLAFEYV